LDYFAHLVYAFGSLPTDVKLIEADDAFTLFRLNHHRPPKPIGYIPPAEAEAHYWRRQAQATAPRKPAEPAALQEG
jgi:hypothetical protein